MGSGAAGLLAGLHLAEAGAAHADPGLIDLDTLFCFVKEACPCI